MPREVDEPAVDVSASVPETPCLVSRPVPPSPILVAIVLGLAAPAPPYREGPFCPVGAVRPPCFGVAPMTKAAVDEEVALRLASVRP